MKDYPMKDNNNNKESDDHQKATTNGGVVVDAGQKGELEEVGGNRALAGGDETEVIKKAAEAGVTLTRNEARLLLRVARGDRRRVFAALEEMRAQRLRGVTINYAAAWLRAAIVHQYEPARPAPALGGPWPAGGEKKPRRRTGKYDSVYLT